MKISSVYGKKVKSTAGKEGYVISVNADGNRLACLICADESENEFTVCASSIKSVKDKITFREAETASACGTPLRLGRPVFDCSGNYIGKITDYTVEKNTLKIAHVGSKKFSCDDVIVGDAVIIKSSARILKSDVKKGNRVIIKRGTPLTPAIEKKAQKSGEYIQTNLKTI